MEFKPLSASSYLALTFPDNDIISYGILTTQSRLVIGGHPGIGKSVMSTQMGIELSQGQDVLGKYACKRSCRVLCIQEEIGPRSYQKRLEQVYTFYKVSDSFHIVSSSSFTFEDASLIVRLKTYIQQQDIDIVIFDPLYKIHARRESDPTEMAQLFQAMDRILNETGVSIILVHHLRKPFTTYKGEVVSQGVQDFRGAVVASWADTLMLLEETTIDDKLKLSFSKARNAPENLLPIYLKFDRKHLRFSPIGDGSQPVNMKEDIISVIQTNGNISEGNVFNHLRSMYGGKVDTQRAKSEVVALKRDGTIQASGGLLSIAKAVVIQEQNPWDLDGV